MYIGGRGEQWYSYIVARTVSYMYATMSELFAHYSVKTCLCAFLTFIMLQYWNVHTFHSHRNVWDPRPHEYINEGWTHCVEKWFWSEERDVNLVVRHHQKEGIILLDRSIMWLIMWYFSLSLSLLISSPFTKRGKQTNDNYLPTCKGSLERCPHFRGVLREGFHCMAPYY